MSSFGLRGRMVQLELPSSSGRSDVVRRGPGRSCGPKPFSAIPLHSTTHGLPVLGEPARPPAGPSTILCSSLGKERKKLAKVLKSHRKVLEKRLSALKVTEVDSPVLSELLSELRTLRSHLESQRALAMMHAGDSSDSSDSDDEECMTRSLSSLACARRQQQQQQMREATSLHQSTAAAGGSSSTTAHSSAAATLEAPRPPSTISGVSDAGTSASGNSSTMVISGLTGEVEVAVPEVQDGWQWDEEAFRAAQFPETAGRIMVCTGGKCQRKGATEVLRAVSALSAGNPGIEVLPCKCVGKCSAGAALRVRVPGQPCATYTQVRPGQLPEVFQEHFGASSSSGPRLGSAADGAVATAAAAAPAVVTCALDLPSGGAEAATAAGGVHCCSECMRDMP